MLDGDVLPLHDDPLNEQADEPLASGEVEPLQAIADGCCEGRDVGGQPLQASPIGMLRLQGLGSCTCGLKRGFQPLAPGLEFVHLNGALLVGINEPVNLCLQVVARPVQPRCLLLRSLGVLMTQLPGLHLLQQHLRLLEPLTQCLPHHRIEFQGSHALGGAALKMAGVLRSATLAGVVEVFVGVVAAGLAFAVHPQTALATHHPCAQQIVMADIARAEPLVLRQALFHLALLLRLHQGRHRYLQPLCPGTHPAAALGVLAVLARVQGPCGLHRLAFAVGGQACVGRVGENRVHRRLNPQLGFARADALGIEAFGHLTRTEVLLQHPLVHLPHLPGLHLVKNHQALRHLGRAYHPVAVRGNVERQHLPAFHLVQAPAAGALQNLRPLVLGNHSLHLHPQEVLGLLAHGPLQEMHLHASLAQLLQMRVPAHVGRQFRSMWGTDSGPCGAPIPEGWGSDSGPCGAPIPEHVGRRW